VYDNKRVFCAYLFAKYTKNVIFNVHLLNISLFVENEDLFNP